MTRDIQLQRQVPKINEVVIEKIVPIIKSRIVEKPEIHEVVTEKIVYKDVPREVIKEVTRDMPFEAPLNSAKSRTLSSRSLRRLGSMHLSMASFSPRDLRGLAQVIRSMRFGISRLVFSTARRRPKPET